MEYLRSKVFRGGVWIGYYSSTWPWGILEVTPNQLRISDGTPKRDYRFTHDQIERIKVVKVFPIIGYGIHIFSKDKKVGQLLYFWYVSFKFKDFVTTLKDNGWL